MESESASLSSAGRVEPNTEVEPGPQNNPAEGNTDREGETESLDPAKDFATSLIREMLERDRVWLFHVVHVE